MPASFGAWVATLLVLLLSGCGSLHMERPVTVTLTSSSDLTMVAAGAIVTFEAIGLASPQGVVILEPATAGGGPTLEVTPTSVTALDKLRTQVTFQVPINLNLPGPIPYLLSFSGTSASGTGFASTNKLSLTLVPGARITLVSPMTGRPGDNATINITGQFTSFAQGSTQVGLGAGISVGGGSEGGFGAVSVSSPNQLTAQIHISSSAALGARDITVKTGSEQVPLANGFTVVVNRLPVAAPGGPYSGTAGTAVQFNGTGSSDPDGDPIGLSWDFGDGSSGAGATPVHTYTNAGTFTVKLTVADDHGGAAAATTTATISAAPPPNHPPTAVPGGPYFGAVGQPVAFDGSQSTDPDNDPLTYTWSFGDGGAGNGAKPAHTYTSASTFTVTLTVTDNHGASTTATTTATISGTTPTNHPPTAVPGGPYNGVVGQPVAFDGSHSTDPDNDTLTYTWSFGDGGAGNGAKPTHIYSAAGNLTVSLTVDDGRGGTDTATATTTITVATQSNVPAVSITSPVPLALFNQSPITVTGMADATVTTMAVNGITATLANGGFTAQGVSLREGSNILTATALDSAGNVGTASVTVVLDTTPPAVHIDAPSDGAVLNTQQVTVTGMVNDIVTGTVNSAQASVVVNGVTATISNRSFVVNGVLLLPGRNTLTAVAHDRAGNESRTQIQVTLQDASVRQRIVILSGDNQTGMIGTVLQQPLAVQAVDSDGAPLANRQLTFTVRRSDGILQSFPDKGQQLRLVTDQQGKASVLFQLGTRVGAGINQAAVTAPGFVGEVIFSASTTAGAPTQIIAASGENQRGIVGTPLPHPFSAAVFDSSGNPLEGVAVKFDVQAGGGSVDGALTVTKNTDSDGIANALLTLGMQEGINNQVVTASCDVCGTPASFAASSVVAGLAAETQVSGVVLDNADQPVLNATASIVGTTLSAISDAQGRFTIKPAPVGTITLLVDGRSSSRPETFPFLAFQIVTLSGQDNTIGGPVYLPPLDLQSAKVVGGDQEVVLTMKDMPGVAFTVFPHSATFPDGSKVGKLMLTQVHSDKVPMPPPNGTAPRVVWTLQPAGVQFNPPIRIQLPNLGGLSPGQVVEAFQFDHDLEQWASVGMTRVSPDGSVATSDPGFGISKAGWGHIPPPPAPTSNVGNCDDHNECTDDSVGSSGSCQHMPISGNQCHLGPNDICAVGRCSGGQCVARTEHFNVSLDPPDNPNPSVATAATNYSFLAQRQFSQEPTGDIIRATARVIPAPDFTVNSPLWGVLQGNADSGFAKDKATRIIPSPSGGTQLAELTFIPRPPSHPSLLRGDNGCSGTVATGNIGHGRCDRSPVLSYIVTMDLCRDQGRAQITQDELDVIRQEYVNHGLPVPNRTDLMVPVNTANFVVANINTTAYDIVVGTPGDLAQAVRNEYNRRIYDDVQLVPVGTVVKDNNSNPMDVPIVGPGQDVQTIGAVLNTTPCNAAPPAPATPCDDYVDAIHHVIMSGPDGRVDTRAVNGPTAGGVIQPGPTSFPLNLDDGWRNPERNEAVGGVPTSRHQFGNAADLKILTVPPGLTATQAYCILQTAADAVILNGVGVNGFTEGRPMPELFIKEIPCDSGAPAVITHVHAQSPP